MLVRITEVSEDEVLAVSEQLEARGFKYDEDFTTIYGEAGAIVGLEFMSDEAAAFGVNALTPLLQ